MKNAVSHAAIIAGGSSSRMGQTKALLKIDDEFLIARMARVLAPLFQETIVVTRDAAIARAASLPSIPDTFPNKGPLGGVRSALAYFNEPTFCVASDSPFLNPSVIAFLCDQFHDCAVLAPRVAGRMETLHAIYAPSCLPVLEAEFQNEKVRSAARVLAPLRVNFIEENALRAFDADLKFLINLNTPEDAAREGIIFNRNSL